MNRNKTHKTPLGGFFQNAGKITALLCKTTRCRRSPECTICDSVARLRARSKSLEDSWELTVFASCRWASIGGYSARPIWFISGPWIWRRKQRHTHAKKDLHHSPLHLQKPYKGNEHWQHLPLIPRSGFAKVVFEPLWDRAPSQVSGAGQIQMLPKTWKIISSFQCEKILDSTYPWLSKS